MTDQSPAVAHSVARLLPDLFVALIGAPPAAASTAPAGSLPSTGVLLAEDGTEGGLAFLRLQVTRSLLRRTPRNVEVACGIAELPDALWSAEQREAVGRSGWTYLENGRHGGAADLTVSLNPDAPAEHPAGRARVHAAAAGGAAPDRRPEHVAHRLDVAVSM